MWKYGIWRNNGKMPTMPMCPCAQNECEHLRASTGGLSRSLQTEAAIGGGGSGPSGASSSFAGVLDICRSSSSAGTARPAAPRLKRSSRLPLPRRCWWPSCGWNVFPGYVSILYSGYDKITDVGTLSFR
jgi:hypothetical protein